MGGYDSQFLVGSESAALRYRRGNHRRFKTACRMGRNRVKGSATFAPGQHSCGRAKDSANDNRESAMTTVMWANGEIVDAQAPVVTGLDRGLLLGYGVFETIAVDIGEHFAI